MLFSSLVFDEATVETLRASAKRFWQANQEQSWGKPLALNFFLAEIRKTDPGFYQKSEKNPKGRYSASEWKAIVALLWVITVNPQETANHVHDRVSKKKSSRIASELGNL